MSEQREHSVNEQTQRCGFFDRNAFGRVRNPICDFVHPAPRPEAPASEALTGYALAGCADRAGLLVCKQKCPPVFALDMVAADWNRFAAEIAALRAPAEAAQHICDVVYTKRPHGIEVTLENDVRKSAPAEASEALRGALLENLCNCVEEPLSLPLPEHLSVCPGVRAWSIVTAALAASKETDHE